MNATPGDSGSPPRTPLPLEAGELLPVIYDELRRLAAARMAQEASGLTIQATALVHEAWLRLERGARQWDSRAHFFAAAGEAMRRILIEQARRRAAAKRGGGAAHEELQESVIAVQTPDDEILAVHDALDILASEDATAADLVKLRFFTGMEMKEAAESLELPLRSAERLWTFARARLRGLMENH